MKNSFMFITLLFVSVTLCFSQTKMTDRIKIAHIEKNFSVKEFENQLWQKAEEITVDKYWSGEDAPGGRQFKAKMLWSDSALYVRFEANQEEPLVVSEEANLKTKTRGLWDRDVCEIFVAPEKDEFRKYFEFEIAPNGEWIDLGIHQMPDRRETDLHYESGMQSAARIEKNTVWMAIKIEWKALGKAPQAGEIWLGNLLRCIGSGETRGYLAWQPTETEKPNFHVPEKFGEFEFTK